MKTNVNTSSALEIENRMIPETLIQLHKYIKRSTAKVKLSTKKIVIFLVDDDLFYLKTLAHTISIQQPSLEIKTFQTGEACLKEMKKRPKIIVLDYYLNSKIQSSLNGLDILKRIKKINSKVKVIMLSAQDSLAIANNCINHGSFDYIIKNETGFFRINNILNNILADVKTTNEGLKAYQVILIIFLIISIISFLMKI